MAGGNLPYHLRVKKDIERRLFVEQLRLVSKYYDLEQYTYAGMAGPFSEDFRQMYDRFNFKHFFSYEMDENVYKRQTFNTPFTKINYVNDKISKFIHEYPRLESNEGILTDLSGTVVWLDYTGFNFDFVEDFKNAISILDIGSIVKITFLTHASQLYSSDESPTIVRKKRVEKIEEILGDNYFMEDVFEEGKMTEKRFPGTVFEMLKKISFTTLIGNPTKFLPISSYIYQDGMTMLTFTGIIIERDKEDEFLDVTGLREWEYGLSASPNPIKIEVPFLSLKEKFNLDACLPGTPGAELGYFDNKEFQSYEKFYKFYPTYAKIV